MTMQPRKRNESTPSRRILIVDDNKMNAHLMARYLHAKDYEADIVLDPTKVETYIRETVPALILLDIVMPGLDGNELLRNIRNTYNRIDLPIFMVSACNLDENIVKCLTAGANDFITKPVNPRILIAKVSRQFLMKDIKADLESFQKRSAEALEAQAISQISNSLSHEINNPLAIMIGRFKRIQKQLAQNTDESRQAAKQSYASITNSNKRIKDLLKDLEIASSQLEKESFSSCSLYLVLRNLEAIWQSVFEANHIDIKIDFPQPQLKVKGSAIDLLTAFSNLIQNSVEAITRLETRNIRITFDDVELSGHQSVLVCFSDSGRKPDDAIARKIFDPFFTTKKGENSKGLGLSVAKGIINRFGGELSFNMESTLTEIVCRLEIVR